MKMRKKLLSAAVIALTGVGSAQAVNISGNGEGEVLIFPYFTVNGGNETLISVVNSTNHSKAVKVRFREYKNSAEVLDFNLYLSPEDVWTGKITEDAGGGARVITADKSCTVPAIPAAGVPFRTFAYDGSIGTDTAEDGVERTREGYVEIIEMGVVGEVITGTATGAELAMRHVDTDADGITDTPNDCSVLTGLWNGGTWASDPTVDVAQPEGGLFGSVAVLNIQQGVEYSTNAVALENWRNNAITGANQVVASTDGVITSVSETAGSAHNDTGSEAPRIADALPATSRVFTGGILHESTWGGTLPSPGANAVTATMMVKSLANEFTLNPAVGAETDWVVTFPGKRDYVSVSVDASVDAPFTEAFNDDAEPNGKSCEQIAIGYWNREEASETPPPGELDFSPQLPEITIVDSLCWEANVLNFGDSDVLSAQSGTGIDIADGFNNGWARITFSDSNFYNDSASGQYEGLPAIGFAATRLLNNNVGVGAAYAATNDHRAIRVISGASEL
jgi:hypothetical protein